MRQFVKAMFQFVAILDLSFGNQVGIKWLIK